MTARGLVSRAPVGLGQVARTMEGLSLSAAETASLLNRLRLYKHLQTPADRRAVVCSRLRALQLLVARPGALGASAPRGYTDTFCGTLWCRSGRARYSADHPDVNSVLKGARPRSGLCCAWSEATSCA